MDDVQQIIQPNWLELHDSPESLRGLDRGVVDQVITRDDGNWNLPRCSVLPELVQESEAVDQRHPEIKNDRVDAVRDRLGQAPLGIGGGTHGEAFKRQHPLERVPHGKVVVHDEHGLNRRHKVVLSTNRANCDDVQLCVRGGDGSARVCS